MAKQRTIQILRGTTAQNDAYTGSAGELTMDTTTNEVRIHDNTTAGGHTLAKKSDINNATLTIQKNGTTVNTFTANASSNVTANITVPTKISDLTNGAITNCITEIPQDIKVEYSGNVITLKSGSKVYVPNGSGVFDTVTTTQDLSVTLGSSTNGQCFIYKNPGNYINYQSLSTSVSGTTDSLSGTPWHLWFDTTNNIINRYAADGTTASPGQSLPFCIVNVSGGQITSIDQVFNGFGYIGSTVFALPGVKGLIPNGRNADGTLKSTALNITAVKTQTSSTVGNNMILRMYSNGSMYWSTGNTYYDPFTNYTMAGGSKDTAVHVGTLSTTTGGVIASFNTKTTFHAVDYSDTEFIAHQAMPSDRYIDLTLGATHSNYTAPADGYVTFVKVSGAANEVVLLSNTTAKLIRTGMISYEDNQWLSASIPVSKGDVFIAEYTASGDTKAFRFVYANGIK